MIAVLGYAVLLKYAGWILLGIWSFCMMRYGIPLLRSWRAARRLQALTDADQAAIYEAQLQRENREWLEAGLYEGNYPGETMPLTGMRRGLYEQYVSDWMPEDWKLPADWSGVIKPK